MKKLIIGSLVGAVLLFSWQSLSWTALHIHDDAYLYSSNQDSILASLSRQLPAEGQYVIPRLPPDASSEAMEKMGEQMKGKPWAVVTYHAAYKNDMTSSLIRGFLIGLVCVIIVCGVIEKLSNKSFTHIFSTVISFAIICFLYVWYHQHNWFDIPWTVLKGEMIDLFAGWGLCAAWLGWWYSKK